ncbi:hypothetical protein DUI87_34155 [Hirundo rustica rustica]|uniref:Uncharacterized protein n=1 Tax=Hirundo rustica rustica TaxID=333673 RepID=A0A3M0IM11_HIRRU|nr:hypothetical protein DUI87_34155 [Hirundo rustica rustica]
MDHGSGQLSIQLRTRPEKTLDWTLLKRCNSDLSEDEPTKSILNTKERLSTVDVTMVSASASVLLYPNLKVPGKCWTRTEAGLLGPWQREKQQMELGEFQCIKALVKWLGDTGLLMSIDCTCGGPGHVGIPGRRRFVPGTCRTRTDTEFLGTLAEREREKQQTVKKGSGWENSLFSMKPSCGTSEQRGWDETSWNLEVVDDEA